jgi:GTP-binding protein
MEIRNIAIIAHVDHGKTTLVDGMMKQTHTFRDNQAEMQETTILDRNDLEREKGITILAKNTAVVWNKVKINIIDTPGHADFSGEVERVINMADGALLIVDSAEGPLPQTQFVLEQALRRNLKIIVVINKIDRKDARAEEVLHQTEDLFIRLAKTEEHLNFPVIYAVGREGKAWNSIPADMNAPGDLKPLFEEIIKSVPKPDAHPDDPFKMLVSTLDFDPYKGSYAIGKVTQGVVRAGQSVVVLAEDTKVAGGRIEHVYTSVGLDRMEIQQSEPGDIIALTGVPEVAIGYTIADITEAHGYPLIKITEPTIKIQIGPNTSPFGGKEGKFSTARQISERLNREIITNIGLRIEANVGSSTFMVSGRGELHLAILIENLRREGYEMEVSKPQVIFKKVDGVEYEPFEEVTIEVNNEFNGTIIEAMGKRKGTMTDTFTSNHGTTRMTYDISSRNLLGFRSEMLTLTRGNGLFASRFLGYFPDGPHIPKLRNGVLVAFESGTSSAYSLETVQNRGVAFIGPGVPVYEGMIIGLNRRDEDIDINCTKTKKLTNMHASNSDIAVHIEPPTTLSLEQCLDFIEDDELLEITPKNLRLRKRYLNKIERLRADRKDKTHE